jgi:hypothetical protein
LPRAGTRQRIDAHDLEATRDQQQCERPRPAADVEYPVGGQLVRDVRIDVEVAPIGVERVVEGGEPRMLVDRVGHSVGGSVEPNQMRLPHPLA